MAQTLSELLANLSVQAKQLEEKYEKAKNETSDKLKSWEKDVTEKYEAEKAEYNKQAEALDAKAKSYWDKVKTAFNDEVTSITEGYNEMVSGIKKEDAKSKAEWLEKEAVLSTRLAKEAVAYAEKAVAKAAHAKSEAEAQ